MKYFLKRYYEKYTDIRWNIGFFDFTSDILFSDKPWKIQWMNHSYNDRWFADPFILKVTNSEIQVLAEEYYDPIGRGRISLLYVDRCNFRLKCLSPVLELPSHLSFPAILRVGDDIYIYPENSVTGRLTLYKYDLDQNKVVKERVIIDEPLTDSVMTTFFDKPYLFSTQLPKQNKNILGIYRADSWDGKYVHVYDLTFSDNIARNAGDVFKIGDRCFRVAQDCNGGYGKGLVFQEILSAKDHFLMKELKRVHPDSWLYHLGMHTFNICRDIAVVDGCGFRRPFIGHFLQSLRSRLR